MMSSAMDERAMADKCGICLDVYTDPKMLPCMHVFCLACLKTHANSRERSSTLGCPLCRQEFTIPSGGFGALALSNAMLERFAEVRQISANPSSETLCDICREEQDVDSEGEQNTGGSGDRHRIPSAEQYCIDCKTKMCSSCTRGHRRQPILRNHKVVIIGGGNDREIEELIKVRPSFCERHPNEVVNMYCTQCAVLICGTCFPLRHQGHTCSEVAEEAQKLVDKLSGHHAAADGLIEKRRQQADKFDAELAVFNGEADEAEKRIKSITEATVQAVMKHQTQLLEELERKRQEVTKQVTVGKETVDLDISMMESFKQFAHKLKTRGTHIDIIRYSQQLEERRQNLEALRRDNGPGPVHVKFTVSRLQEQLTRPQNNTIGELKIGADGKAE